MAKLIQKSKYIKPTKAGGYMRYVATRDNVDIPKNYMKYIANRPNTEKHGVHGLFSLGDSVELKTAIAEVSAHQGDVWTFIYSLRREDAERLGYDNADSWRELIMKHTDALAQAMKIPPKDFRWYAAFHDEGHHPHIHMMVWSTDPKQGYLTTQGIEKMRSKLTNAIFKDELHNLYVKKDISYKELTQAAAESMRGLISKMESGTYVNPVIEKRMMELAEILSKTSGKKQYSYLKKPVKAIVDEIVAELEKEPEVAQCYAEWNKLRDELEGYYKQKPREHLPLSQQKEFRVLKNMVIQEAERLNLNAPSINNEDSAPAQTVVSATTNLLRHMGRIFRENTMPPANPEGIRIDSKRRKKLLEKRMALGHKADDHEEYSQKNINMEV